MSTKLRVFGYPVWEGVKRRVAKKHINSRGRDMFSRFVEMSSMKPGDIVSACRVFNERIVSVDPVYFNVRGGRVLFDLDFTTDHGGCSMYHCGVGLPISYQEAIEYKSILPVGDAYFDAVVREDGTFTCE